MSESVEMDIRIVDRRETPLEDLPKVLRNDLELAESALLWTAKRPTKNWHNEISLAKPLVLSSGAQFEQILWLKVSPITLPEAILQEHQALLGQYKGLFVSSSPVSECTEWESYRNLLTTHILEQERALYPGILNKLPIERPLRELGYEHRGLEKGLSRLPELLTRAKKGELSSRERELFDLDFYHLLEHHLEREAQALYPTICFLERGRQPQINLL